jgi:hypothetical protein
LFVFVASIFLRQKNLRRDLDLVEQLIDANEEGQAELNL